MKDEDEKRDGDPKKGRESAQMMPVTMEGEDVMLVGGRHVDLVNVDRVLQVLHVLNYR